MIRHSRAFSGEICELSRLFARPNPAFRSTENPSFFGCRCFHDAKAQKRAQLLPRERGCEERRCDRSRDDDLSPVGGAGFVGETKMPPGEAAVRHREGEFRRRDVSVLCEKLDRLDELLDDLDGELFDADSATYGRLLRACKEAGSLSAGKRVHLHISRSGLEQQVCLGNQLVGMYGRCGSLADARRTFDKMQRRDIVSWNTMIAAYARYGYCKEALRLFEQIRLEGLIPNEVTFVTVLNACRRPAALADGRLVHACIVDRGFGFNVIVGTAVIRMYAKCGILADARRIFDEMSERNVVSWTVMIAAYVQQGCEGEALQLFGQMQAEGVVPNRITLVTILNACPGPAALGEGRLIHARIIDIGLELDIVVATAIVKMYGKCGCLNDANTIFRKVSDRDVILWNVMIAAYAQHERCEEALQLFEHMQSEGKMPDEITLATVLNACASTAALAEGKLIHARIVGCGHAVDVIVGTAIVEMYGKCGNLDDARKVFDKMLERDVVLWTALIGAYAHHGSGKEALQLFQQMQLEGLVPDKFAFATVLDACANLAALSEGKRIHACTVERGFELDVVVGNAIVNMYGKCGSLEDARRMFDKMPEQNVVSWTTMIAAYAQHGHGEKALQLFQLMQKKGKLPNEVTFIGILSACSRSGLVDEGYHYFIAMSKDFGIAPREDHYGCMVDLLGRAGRLEEAEELINNMPFQAGVMLWKTLLGACRLHGDVDRGKCAADHVFELDPYDDAVYIVLSNIYAEAGQWDDAANVRKAMVDMGLKKEPGRSSIEVNNKVHEFGTKQEIDHTHK